MMLCPLNRLPCDSTGCGNGRCLRADMVTIPAQPTLADAALQAENNRLRAEVAKLQSENARLRIPSVRSRR